VLVGLLLVPLPGPGWLIVFLGTEFPSAARFAVYLRRLLIRAWQCWRSRRTA
jgi:hypothetical protein